MDLNTASAPLLEYISGVSRTIARNIVEYREANGRFTNRKQLLKVAKLGPKAFEQCAGFMRITDGDNPLDATSVHPESYEATMQLLSRLELTMDDVRALQAEAKKQRAAGSVNGSSGGNTRKGKDGRNAGDRQIVIRNTNTAMGKALAAAMGGMVLEEAPAKNERNAGNRNAGNQNSGNQNAGNNRNAGGSASAQGKAVVTLAGKIRDKKKLAEELGIGEITLTDILKELEKPARDPRENMPAPILRSDVLDMKDLKPGMILKGTVRNVIDFGVFVDIGVHQDGLVHISQITDRYIRHPLEAVSVGDIVEVKVLSVDVARKRIQLTMKL